MASNWSALILSGGTSKRFGSDKSEAKLEGRALIDLVLDAIPGDVPVVVVGPNRLEFDSRVQVIQEQPPFGGPVAGIAAGISLVKTELVAILATDMPYAPSILPLLIANLDEEIDAILPLDDSGFLQPFSGIYRRSALAAALEKLATVDGESMRNLVADLRVKSFELAGDARALLDIDTQDDLQREVKA